MLPVVLLLRFHLMFWFDFFVSAFSVCIFSVLSSLSLPSCADGTCANFRLSLSTYPPPPLPQFIKKLFLCCLASTALSLSWLFIHIPNQLSLLLLLLFFFSFLLLLTSGCFEGKLSYSFSPHCHFCVMPAWLNRCCTLCCKCLDSTSAALVICWETSEPLHHEIKLATCMIWCHVIASCCHICSCAFCS